jgi:hypothetical protein
MFINPFLIPASPIARLSVLTSRILLIGRIQIISNHNEDLMNSNINNLNELKILVKAVRNDKIFANIKDRSSFEDRIVFREESVTFLDKVWKMQIFERDNYIILHFDKYFINLNFRACVGSIFLKTGEMEELTSDFKGLSVTNQEEDEENECEEIFLAAIYWDEEPTYKSSKNSVTYQPPKKVFHEATLEIVSKGSGLLTTKLIEYQNYKGLLEYFRENSDFDGLFMQKSDGTQYNCSGNDNGCSKIILVVKSDKLPMFPKKCPEISIKI